MAQIQFLDADRTAAVLDSLQIDVNEYELEPQFLAGMPVAKFSKSSAKVRNIYLWLQQFDLVSYLHDDLLSLLRFDLLTASGDLLAGGLECKKWKNGLKISVERDHLGPEERSKKLKLLQLRIRVGYMAQTVWFFRLYKELMAAVIAGTTTYDKELLVLHPHCIAQLQQIHQAQPAAGIVAHLADPVPPGPVPPAVRTGGAITPPVLVRESTPPISPLPLDVNGNLIPRNFSVASSASNVSSPGIMQPHGVFSGYTAPAASASNAHAMDATASGLPVWNVNPAPINWGLGGPLDHVRSVSDASSTIPFGLPRDGLGDSQISGTSGSSSGSVTSMDLLYDSEDNKNSVDADGFDDIDDGDKAYQRSLAEPLKTCSLDGNAMQESSAPPSEEKPVKDGAAPAGAGTVADDDTDNLAQDLATLAISNSAAASPNVQAGASVDPGKSDLTKPPAASSPSVPTIAKKEIKLLPGK